MGRLGHLPAEAPHAERVAAHMARPLGARVLVTTPGGEWTLLGLEDYRRYLKGGVSNEEPLGVELRRKGFFRDYQDFRAEAERMASRERLDAKGPDVHVLLLEGMAPETAMKAVDLAFTSGAPELRFELRGEGPLERPVRDLVVRYAREKGRVHGRALRLPEDGPDAAAAAVAAALAAEGVSDVRVRPLEPRGAGGLRRLAYGPDGGVYAASEADPDFRIGDVGGALPDMLEHPAVRACWLAASPLAQPMCSQCAYSPFCPVDPAENVRTQGGLWGHMPLNARCREMMGLFDVLFERLGGAGRRPVLEAWLDGKVVREGSEP